MAEGSQRPEYSQHSEAKCVEGLGSFVDFPSQSYAAHSARGTSPHSFCIANPFARQDCSLFIRRSVVSKLPKMAAIGRLEPAPT